MTVDERNFTWRTYYEKAKLVADTCNDSKFTYDDGLANAWASLDALIGLKYQNFDGFKKKYMSLFPMWKKSEKFSNSLDELISLAPVQNMQTEKWIPLTDKKNLAEILNVIYTVRGNMHHGRKDLDDKTQMSPRNKELVEHSFNVSFDLLEQILQSENIAI